MDFTAFDSSTITIAALVAVAGSSLVVLLRLFRRAAGARATLPRD
jgi:hypothetical protein